MENSRPKMLLIVSRRLFIFAALSLLATSLVFGMTFFFNDRLMISWLVLECGIIGGFVSIQQRLSSVKVEELGLLAESWATILVIPIYGGIFALVLYVLLLAGLIQGHLFPAFYIPRFDVPPTSENIAAFLTETYPAQGADLAKLIFWSFVAGFSERFVPQIINNVSSSGESKPS
ncbi:MAG: hypothetical protein P1U54_04845 [Immundisolibacteraceae bacterium]|nr:hypothetical protein [Immundisolibacteraceae bacterium]